MRLYVQNESLLMFAIKHQNKRAVSVLVEAGAPLNVANGKGNTPMSTASHKGNIEIMKILINGGATVNAHAGSNSGSTALIQAAHFGHLEAVKLLLAHGAAPDYANAKGTTALMRSAQEGYDHISTALIETGKVDVNRKNLEGMNALMLGSQRGHSSTVLLLIQEGASMDDRTTQGSTALMLACKRGHTAVVQVLVEQGSEIMMRDRRGRTAFETAINREHFSLLHCLTSKGQVELIQEIKRQQRNNMLKVVRRVFLDNCHGEVSGAVVKASMLPEESSVEASSGEVSSADIRRNVPAISGYKTLADIDGNIGDMVWSRHPCRLSLAEDTKLAISTYQQYMLPKDGAHIVDSNSGGSTAIPPFAYDAEHSVVTSTSVTTCKIQRRRPKHHEWSWAAVLIR